MVPILLEESVRIPPGIIDLESFRRWARSDEFPERGRVSYLCGEIWVDLSMEQLFTHNGVKTEVNFVLTGLTRSTRRGYYFSDGVLLTNMTADLVTVPDGLFVSYKAIETQRVRLIEGADRGYIEIMGSPDMVLEVVSAKSVRKDTEVLREAYWQTGIDEYWLVDARREPLRFDILRRGPGGYTATRKQKGWLRSTVFGCAFRLSQETDSLGHPQYTLAVRRKS